MPGEDGLSILRSLMHDADGPGIIMLSAISSEIDRIVALEMGADDYVLKPSSPREIMARIRSVLRRRAATAARGGTISVGHTAPAPTDCFAFAGWTFDSRRRKLTAPGGAIVAVTETEYRMLAIFLRDPQVVHSRENLADLTGRDNPHCNDRTIDVHVSRLRRTQRGLSSAIASGATLDARGAARKEACTQMAAAQAQWEASATEEGWRAWCAGEGAEG